MRSTPCAVGACRGRLGKPEDLGSLCRGAGGDPGPGQLPISKGHWLPTLPFGFWSSALSPSLMQTTLPSFPTGPSASSLPSTRRPASPQPHEAQAATPPPLPPAWLQRPGDGQAHTPASPLGATLTAPPYQAGHPPLWLLCGQHAGARCLPTPLPRVPAELGIQEQGLCLGLTGCLAWEEHVQPGLKRAPQAGVTAGGSCGTPLPSGRGSDLWGSGGSSGFIPGFPKMPRFQAHHKHILGRALPKLKGHVVSTTVAPPRGAVPWPLRGLGFLQTSFAFSWGLPGVSSG